MLQDYKPKEYAVTKDDISNTIFIIVEYDIPRKGKRKHRLYMTKRTLNDWFIKHKKYFDRHTFEISIIISKY
jgi:hypothetical protein